MTNENMLEVVGLLVGYTEPYGDSSIDEVRYKNQEKIICLLENGIEDLIHNAEYKNRSEYSISKIGNRAYEALKSLQCSIEEIL